MRLIYWEVLRFEKADRCRGAKGLINSLLWRDFYRFIASWRLEEPRVAGKGLENTRIQSNSIEFKSPKWIRDHCGPRNVRCTSLGVTGSIISMAP